MKYPNPQKNSWLLKTFAPLFSAISVDKAFQLFHYSYPLFQIPSFLSFLPCTRLVQHLFLMPQHKAAEEHSTFLLFTSVESCGCFFILPLPRTLSFAPLRLSLSLVKDLMFAGRALCLSFLLRQHL